MTNDALWSGLALVGALNARVSGGALPLGVGGVSSGEDAIAMMMAGANAVQVGTATFADPRAPWRVVKGLARWARDHDVAKVVDLIGVAHE